MQPCVVGRLDDDDVGHEVGAEGERERLDLIRLLRFAAGERQDRELHTNVCVNAFVHKSKQKERT